MYFDVMGPFDIDRLGPKELISKKSLTTLKERVDYQRAGLSQAIGCYVFALRAGKGYTPWYVGRASKRSIVREALNPSNCGKYNEVAGKGTPVLFMIPMLTKGRKLRKPTAAEELPSLNFLERWLISVCLDKNVALLNNKETRFLRNIHVVGVFNAKKGEANDSSRKLVRALR